VEDFCLNGKYPISKHQQVQYVQQPKPSGKAQAGACAMQRRLLSSKVDLLRWIWELARRLQVRMVRRLSFLVLALVPLAWQQ